VATNVDKSCFDFTSVAQVTGKFYLQQVLLLRSQAWKYALTSNPTKQHSKRFQQSERSMRSTDPEASHEKRDAKTWLPR